MILSVCLIGQTTGSFAAPIGINRLLKSAVIIYANDCLFIIAPSYMETGGADAFIQPWFWILWLFVGPVVRNLCFQWYIFIATRTLVRTEGLLTQLVFEHSLRMRLKAETPNEKNEEDNAVVIGTPDSASIAEGTKSDERASEPFQASTAVSLVSSSDSQSISKDRTKGKDKDKDDSSTLKSDAKEPSKGKKEAKNLIGKINNLVTTDLGNIVSGRHFLLVCTLSILLFEIKFIA
jgi:hypothetical protein